MDFPKKFYFSRTKEGFDYGTTPSGSLSVPRLIRGLPYWTRPSAPRNEEKKTLNYIGTCACQHDPAKAMGYCALYRKVAQRWIFDINCNE